MLNGLKLWRDKRGRVSAVRLVTLAALFVPVAIAAWAYATTGFGARPLNDLIHRTGYWGLIFVLASLAVTPLRNVARLAALIDVRRMIGVGAFCYLAVHFSLYVADQSYDLLKIVIEIAARLYLTIGFVALIGMGVLAATSTDGMVRRLGGLRWRRLHSIVYAIALLALIHYFQQTKADVSVPIYTAGLFGWLMTYRILAWWRGTPDLPTLGLVALAIIVGALTVAGEAIGIGIKFGVSPLRVLEAAWDFHPDTIRPGWLVLASGLGVALLEFGRVWWRTGAGLGAQTAQSRL